tara:strand:+ start:1505 stop:1702 length:198 start_codon:yes stop_codon:yes gene_type:complete
LTCGFRDGLALDQYLHGLSRPFTAGSLAEFWGIEARQADGALFVLLAKLCRQPFDLVSIYFYLRR